MFNSRRAMRFELKMTRRQQQVRQMLGIVRVHVFGECRKAWITCLAQGGEQRSRRFTRIRATGLIAWPVLVMRQELFAMVLIERAVTGKFQFGLLRRNFRVDLGIGIPVVCFFCFGPVRLVAMFFAQGRRGIFQHELRMRTGIAKDMHEVLAMPFAPDIAHARRNAPWIEVVLAGAGGAQDVEEFIDFRWAHRSILSFRHSRCACNDGQWLSEAYTA